MIIYDFTNGLVILQKYFTDKTKIYVIENSAISIEKLRIIVESDAHTLSMLGWDIQYAQGKDNSCLVEFRNIEYMDT